MSDFRTLPAFGFWTLKSVRNSESQASRFCGNRDFERPDFGHPTVLLLLNFNLKIIVFQIVTDLKVCIGSAGLVRCLCTHPADPNTITVGHSSGFISQLDTRTGKLRQAWKVSSHLQLNQFDVLSELSKQLNIFPSLLFKNLVLR